MSNAHAAWPQSVDDEAVRHLPRSLHVKDLAKVRWISAYATVPPASPPGTTGRRVPSWLGCRRRPAAPSSGKKEAFHGR
jgi:hypothetical protein